MIVFIIVVPKVHDPRAVVEAVVVPQPVQAGVPLVNTTQSGGEERDVPRLGAVGLTGPDIQVNTVNLQGQTK